MSNQREQALPIPTNELVIVFRQLVLFHRTAEGLIALSPSEGHQATLRDVRSDTTCALNQAEISVIESGSHVMAGPTSFATNDRLVSFNKIAGKTLALKGSLTLPTVDPALNARFALSGGSLEAFPASAFPEFAELRWIFKTLPREGQEPREFDQRITDTCVYRLPLDINRMYTLQIQSPRQTVRIEIPGNQGRRFEFLNADRKVGEPPENPFDLKEFALLADLLDLPAGVIPIPLPALRTPVTDRPLERFCDEVIACPEACSGEGCETE